MPDRDDPRDPWTDLYGHRPADAPHLECYVEDKEPPPVLYGPKGHPLPPTRQPDRFGYQPRRNRSKGA